MAVYQELGLTPAVNASGKMTALGGSVLGDGTVDAMAEAARSHVVMDDLLQAAGKVIAEACGTEDACPTTGAASGVAIAVAAVVAGADPYRVNRLPDAGGHPDEVVLQKGHAVDFGAPITQMVRIGGGRPVEVGAANKVSRAQLAGAIGERTAALLYVQSHHAVQKGQVSLAEVVALGRERGIPVIVDAAAEEDLRKWPATGADLVVFSGGKAIGGPTSGFVCGRAELVAACRAQYGGIARPMKVGKETVAGLVAAVRAYASGRGTGPSGAEQRERMGRLAERLGELPGLRASVAQDEAGREIHRAVVAVDPAAAGMTAAELSAALSAGTPPIFTRDHQANTGRFAIDPRPLGDGDAELIAGRIEELLGGGAAETPAESQLTASEESGLLDGDAAKEPAESQLTTTEESGLLDGGAAEEPAELQLTVTEESGLHARPAAAFAQAAARRKASVTVARADGGEPVPAHSVLSLLTLNIRRGDAIVLHASGEDAGAALAELAAIADPARAQEN